jgi:hypothetical protein
MIGETSAPRLPLRIVVPVFLAFASGYFLSYLFRTINGLLADGGTAFAVHGLWATRWLTDVDRLAPQRVVDTLLAMGAGLTAGACVMGLIADRPRRLGVRPKAILGSACFTFVGLQVGVVWRLGLRAAFALPLILETMALAWFLLSSRVTSAGWLPLVRVARSADQVSSARQ